jgi:hypothetical protein
MGFIKKKTRASRQASTGSKQISFLPEPNFNPKLPSKNTLAYRVLSRLLRGEKLTQPMLLNEKDSWRLAVCIPTPSDHPFRSYPAIDSDFI